MADTGYYSPSSVGSVLVGAWTISTPIAGVNDVDVAVSHRVLHVDTTTRSAGHLYRVTPSHWLTIPPGTFGTTFHARVGISISGTAPDRSGRLEFRPSVGSTFGGENLNLTWGTGTGHAISQSGPSAVFDMVIRTIDGQGISSTTFGDNDNFLSLSCYANPLAIPTASPLMTIAFDIYEVFAQIPGGTPSVVYLL